MDAPLSGLDNTTTVLWSTQEASTINPVVADLLRIYDLHYIHFFLNPSALYHPGQDNCMTDNASCLFDLPDTSFLAHISSAYPQLLSLWQIFLCFRNNFPEWSTWCTGRCEISNYSRYDTAEAVPEVDRLILNLLVNTDLQDPSITWIEIIQVGEISVFSTWFGLSKFGILEYRV